MRVVRIHNTRTLDHIYVSENMLDDVSTDPHMTVLGDAESFSFDPDGNIIGL